MPLLLLICLTLACLPISWPEPPFGLGRSGAVAITGGIVTALLLMHGLAARDVVRRLALDSGSRDAVGRRQAARRLAFSFLNLGGFTVALVGGWGWLVRDQLTVGDLFLPGAELLTLAPYIVTLLGSWVVGYDAERALHRTAVWQRRDFWTRPGYVFFLLRHHLLMVFLPVLLMIAQMGVFRLYPALLDSPWAKLSALAGVFTFIVLVPSLIPLFLGLQPMPPGTVHDRLAAAATRLGVRYRRLYVWDTRGGVATAMVAGLIPRLRHIVFTDLLLKTMPEDEVEAVFGHEVGHVKHGHLLYYAAFLLLSFTALGAGLRLVELSEWGSQLPADLMLMMSVISAGVYLFVAFGFLSRRCERQADVFGCRAMSCAQPFCVGHDADTPLVAGGTGLCRAGVAVFVRALERVEDVNGMVRGAASPKRNGLSGLIGGLFRLVGVYLGTWQHSTIAKRIAFLQAVAADPAIERRFQIRITALRWMLLAALLMIAGGVAAWAGWREVLDGI